MVFSCYNILMPGHDFGNMPILSAKKLVPILDKFNVPEGLIYDEGADAGEDELLYRMHGKVTGDKYLVWCRDYFGSDTPDIDNNYLRMYFNIEIIRWYDVKPYNDACGAIIEDKGLLYALGKYRKINYEEDQD